MTRREEEIAWAAGLLERRIEAILEWGTVYGPYRPYEADGWRRKPLWVWIARAENGLDCLAFMWPWLSLRRRQRAQEITGIDFTCFLGVRKLLIQPGEQPSARRAAGA